LWHTRTKPTRSHCYKTTGKEAITPLSKDALLGKEGEISDYTTVSARERIGKTATIGYNNNGSPNRDQFINWIQQQGMSFYLQSVKRLYNENQLLF
jgi:hypothetical protein